MTELLITFNAVFPSSLLILIGYAARFFKLTDADGIAKTNRLCYYLLVSMLVFNNVYTAEIKAGESIPVLLFCLVGIFIEMFFAILFVRRIEQDPPTQSVMIQSLFRTNVVILGLPIAQAMYEESGLMGIVYALVVPLFNVLSTVLFECYRKGKISPAKLLLNILKNPLIIAALCAFALRFAHITLPTSLMKVVSQMSTSGGCLVLIVLGASLELSKVGQNRRNLAISLIGRLMVLPCIALLIAVPMGFRGLPLLCILIVFGCPVASTSHTMAHQLGGNAELAAQMLAFGTVLSCFSMFFWIYLLKNLALL